MAVVSPWACARVVVARWMVLAAVLLALCQPAAAQQRPAAARLLGLELETLTAALAEANGLLLTEGVLVRAVDATGPAAKQDLREGDGLTHLDGRPMRSAADIETALAAKKPGETVALIRHRAEAPPRRLQVVLAAPVVAKPVGPLPEPVLMLDTGGHTALINGLAFTHDGRQIVSAGDDEVIRVWDWASGRTVRTIRGEVGTGDEGKIFAMALSPVVAGAAAGHRRVAAGHRWVAVGGWMGEGDNNFIRLHDFATGRLERLLSGHTNVVQGLAFSPDGRLLISGSYDNTAIIWDVASGRLLYKLEGHKDSIYAVGFSPDGARAVSGSFDNTLKLWDVGSGRLIATMTGHADKVQTLAVSPTDGAIASGSIDGEVRLWDGRTGAPVRLKAGRAVTGDVSNLFAKQGGRVGKLVFSPDGRRLLATCGGAGCNYAQRVWDVAGGQLIATHSPHDNIVLAAVISSDGVLAVTGGGNDHAVHVWEKATGRRHIDSDGRQLALVGTGQTNWAAAFSRDGSSIAWGSMWRRAANGVGHSSEMGSPLQHSIRLPTADARLGVPLPIAAADAERSADWSRARMEHNGLRLAHRRGGGFGYPEAVLDIIRDGKPIRSIERGDTDGLGHGAYTVTPDGRTIVSGGANGVLIAYDLDGKTLGHFVGHESEVWAVTPSPDGRLLVSGSADHTVRLWNLATRELIVSLFHGTDGEWVMWTPQGYYTGSPGAGNIVGWQQNRGHDKEATYVDGDMLRHVLRRPDIVERAIVLASAKAAVDELPKDKPSLAELVAYPPPSVALFGDTTSATGKARIVLEIERTGRPVASFDVHRGAHDKDGTFKSERKLVHRTVPLPPGYVARNPGRELRAVEVDLRRGVNELAVIARTDAGETTSSTLPVNSTADALGEKGGTLRILSIGIDRYPGSSAAYPKDLSFAGKDARDFAATAGRQIGRRHANVERIVMYNGAGGSLEPTKANIEAQLRGLAAGKDDATRQNDTVLLFIAGHGESRGGQYVLLPTDFRRRDVADPGQNVVDWAMIRNALASAPGQRAVLLDTCHAGNADNDNLVLDARSLKFAAFTAARANAIATEDKTLGNGRFTHALKAGIEGAAAQGNVVSVYDLGAYIQRRVKELSNGAQIAEFYPGAGNFDLVQR